MTKSQRLTYDVLGAMRAEALGAGRTTLIEAIGVKTGLGHAGQLRARCVFTKADYWTADRD